MPTDEPISFDLSLSVSQWSPSLIGFEPWTDELDPADPADLRHLQSLWESSSEVLVLVHHDGKHRRVSIWRLQNHFFEVMTDQERAIKIRDIGSRRITGLERALVCYVAEGRHLNASGEWKSKRDRETFEALCKHPNIHPIISNETTQ